jgi:hypothetical protein
VDKIALMHDHPDQRQVQQSGKHAKTEGIIILDLYLLSLLNPTNDSSHCDDSCVCEILSGSGVFESWVSWMNHLARRQPCGHPVMS